MFKFLSKKYSTLLKNGTIINSDRSFKGDIFINNDKITRVHDYTNKISQKIETDKNTKIIDCSGKYLIPGGIDTHVHMELPFMSEIAVDDFHKGTKAAISGGTTCIIDFILPEKNESLTSAYEAWRKKADKKVNCDYALHVILNKWTPEISKEMENMIKLGVQSFKVFLAYKDALMMGETALYEILERVKELGGITLVHAENGALIDKGQNRIKNLGITGPEGHYLSRPETFEALATHQAITIADYINSPLYVAHVMSKESNYEVKRAIDKGTVVFSETLAASLGTDGRNMWNTNWDIAGPKVMSPPLNPNPEVKKHLMRSLHSGSIHTVGSDNCTFCLSQKKNGLNDFTKISNGVNGIEDRMAVLWTKGVDNGFISKSEFVKVSSTNAAKIFNMYPRKGVLQEGSDADIVVWDADTERVISRNAHNQAVDFNVFEGMVVKGTADMTFSAGKLVYEYNKGKSAFSNLNQGRYVPREPFGFAYDRIKEIDDYKNPLKLKVDRTGGETDNPMHPEYEEMRKLRSKVVELSEKIKKLEKKI